MTMRSGVGTIIGRPNAGKSTLLNRLVGQKIAIVTHKAQTTRNRIQGYVNVPAIKGKRPAAQLVLVDTPGVHKPDSPMGRRMMQEVYDSISGIDLLLVIVDATREPDEADEQALLLAKRNRVPCILLLNKVDLLDKTRLLPLIETLKEKHDFAEIIPISARKGTGEQELLTACARLLPPGERRFDEEEITDQPARFLAAELIREKVLLYTAQEVPYAAAVKVERWQDPPKAEAATRIAAVIYCEREGQKGIIIGRRGTLLKKIGSAARVELERLLGGKVLLELFVKVQENWRESRQFLNDLDWRQQLEDLSLRERKD
ncbi:MAG: GTPase Era [Acidobacteriales bacterium]|nr:GTPase Era [Terriglobales bacterium]